MGNEKKTDASTHISVVAQLVSLRSKAVDRQRVAKIEVDVLEKMIEKEGGNL